MRLAGGLWLVRATGSFLGATGTELLLQLGPKNARVELVKLQVSYQEMLLGGQPQNMNTPCVIGSLEKRRDEIEQRIEEELKLNEKRSTRIRDMEAIQVAVTDCIRWMRKHAVS